MRRLESFLSAQEMVARILTRHDDLSIRWEGDGPKVDLQKRVIYMGAPPSSLDPTQKLLVLAHCDHEIAHLIHTAEDACDPDPVVFMAGNILEDQRVELAMGHAYAGSARHFTFAREKSLAELRSALERAPATVSAHARALFALASMVRGASRDVAMWEVGGGDDVELLLDSVADLEPRVRQLSSAHESLAVARAIVERWRAAGGAESAIGAAVEAVRETSAAAVAKRAVESLPRSVLSSNTPYVPYVAEDTYERVSRTHNALTSRLERDARHDAEVLRRSVAPHLVGWVPGERRYARSGSILDPRKLVGAVVADEPPFLHNRPTPAPEGAAISLLLDASASMVRTDPPRLAVAVRIAMALSIAAESLGVQSQVLAFSTGMFERSPRASPHHTRGTPVALYEVKAFGASLQQARHAFANVLTTLEHRCTIPGEAFLTAARQLLELPGTGRRIIISIEDGQPEAKDDSCEALADHLHDVVRRAGLAGIDVVAIGVGCPEVELHYPRTAVVATTGELLRTGLDEIARALSGCMR